MEFENIIKLIETVSKSHLTQFSYENEGIIIKMKTDKESGPVLPIEGVPVKMQMDHASVPNENTGEPGDSNSFQIKSPLVGTFYAAPSPEEEPFVKIGDRVKKGQVLGIIEAMKLLNEIESEYEGIIKDILISNEDVVEFDQVMFLIENE